MAGFLTSNVIITPADKARIPIIKAYSSQRLSAGLLPALTPLVTTPSVPVEAVLLVSTVLTLLPVPYVE